MILRALLFLCLVFHKLSAQSPSTVSTTPDVLHYDVKLEPNFSEQSIKGEVSIHFLIDENVRHEYARHEHAREVVFNSGELVVDQVKGEGVSSFRQQDHQLIIVLSEQAEKELEINISYHGKPQRGLIFLEEAQQMYTVYFTSEWMVCHDQVNDRASINMDIIIPDHLHCIASGTLMEKKAIGDDKTLFSWKQEEATPAYVYGFAIGNFQKLAEEHQGTSLNYYAEGYDTDEMAVIFKPTAEILAFFEKKAGVPYFQKSYTQLLVGSHYQEMSGFAVLKQGYGEMNLKDSTEINLITHEFAHQWWGNMITCENLGHFWLNEAFATYMSAAFNEHYFGRDKYMENINAYQEVYKKIKAKGADKPLVFDGWENPTADDRNLVYFKGAYVLHLLREAMGDEAFWKGVRYYSQKYYGKSVLSIDFQQAMEISSGDDLSDFFEQWVY